MADTVMADRVVEETTANGIIEKFKEIPLGLPNPDKKTIIEALRWLDTIHDFYPVNDKNPRGENIRAILSRRYWPSISTAAFDNKDNNGISNFMETLSTGKPKPITPSSVEVQTEAFYHTNFNTINIGEHVIDVKTITDKYIAVPGTKAADILLDVGVTPYQPDADLQLLLGKDRSVFKERSDATNFLGNVILTFFFGEDINRDVYFLIDAQAGRLDCMLQDIDQVNTLVNVLTIGDSAVTNPNEVTKTKSIEKQVCGVEDFNNKFKRKVYLSLPNTIPYNKGNKYVIESNEFTKHSLDIWYQDADLPFSKQNNSAARLYVQTKDKTHEWFSEFSLLAKKGKAARSPNSGASVGTLKQLITIIDGIGSVYNINTAKQAIFNFYKYETEFNLTPILCGMLDTEMRKDDIISFLYDYKRGGDHEQVNSANYLYKQGLNVILLTGDRLCSLYARLIGQPCIYIHGDEYDMYRFLRETTDEQKKAQAYNVLTARKIFIETEIAKIQPAEITTKLDELSGQIEALKAALDANKFEDKLYNFIFDSLLKKIERIRLISLQYASTSTPVLQYITTVINPKTDLPVADIPDTEQEIEALIKTLNDTYTGFYNENKELFNFALYYFTETKKITKDNFISKALDYDNLIIKQILSFFTIKSLEIKPKYKEDRKDPNKSYTVTMKSNIIGRFGGDFITLIMDEYLKYLKKCIENSGGEIDEDKLSAAARARRSEIETQTTEILNSLTPEDFEKSIYATYNPIFDGLIKAFMIEYINAPPVKEEIPMELTSEGTPVETTPVETTPVETTPVETTPVETPGEKTPMETPVETLRMVTPEVVDLAEESSTDTTPVETLRMVTPENTSPDDELGGGGRLSMKIIKKNRNMKREEGEIIKIMKISLLEWFIKKEKMDKENKGKGESGREKSVVKEGRERERLDIASVWRERETNKRKDLFKKISEFIRAFEKENDEKFFEIYKDLQPQNRYEKIDEATGKERAEERRRKDLLEYIKLTRRDNFIEENLMLEDFIQILNYRLIYEYNTFYGENTSYLAAGPYQPNTIEKLYIKPLLENYYADIQADHKQELINAYLSQTEEDETQRAIVIDHIYEYVGSQYPASVYEYLWNGFVHETIKTSKAHIETGTAAKHIEAKKEEAQASMRAKNETKENIRAEQIKSKREALTWARRGATPGPEFGSRRPDSRRPLFPKRLNFTEVASEVAGGKRTRKYKNKRNKKTRQQRKKTRKNKTLKKRREKGKQRTRRNF
jgi:hypothetical protein